MLSSSGVEDDWVELYNPTDTPADISGWLLTDNVTVIDPSHFSFPPSKKKKKKIEIQPLIYVKTDTLLGAKSYIVVEQTDLGFGIRSSGGETLYLIAADGVGGSFTGYTDSRQIEAADEGRTHGRHINSQGDIQFALMQV